MADIDPYKILQVDSEAEDEVIQAAYRRLARKYHPDLANDARRRDPDGGDQRGLGADRRAGEARRPTIESASVLRRAGADAERDRSDARRDGRRARPGALPPLRRGRWASSSTGPLPSPRRSRGTGPRVARRRAAATTNRCARPTGSGPPAHRPAGRRARVLNFGRYAGWSLGEVARTDLEYIEWLDRAPIGRNYRQEIDEILRTTGRRVAADAGETERRGLFRRR